MSIVFNIVYGLFAVTENFEIKKELVKYIFSQILQKINDIFVRCMEFLYFEMYVQKCKFKFGFLLDFCFFSVQVVCLFHNIFVLVFLLFNFALF